MKVHFYICGEGLGHTSRCLAVGRELVKAGHKISYHAYRFSKAYIERHGFDVIEIPNEIKLVGKEGGLSIKWTVIETIKNTKPLGFLRILKQLWTDRPDVVVADSYFIAVYLARLLKIPVYLIVNQTNTYTFFQDRGLVALPLSRFLKYVMRSSLWLADKIIVPDYPPPYTICAENIEVIYPEKIVYTGPLVREYPEDVDPIELKKPMIVSLIGGFGYREKLLHKIIKVAELNPDLYFTLLPGTVVDKNRLECMVQSDNVEVMDYVKDVFIYIKAADLVIAPGGHSTMMECLSFGTPMISVPDLNHAEQNNNADRIEELGLGRKLDYHTPEDMIGDTIREIMESNEVRENTRKLMQYSRELYGPQKFRMLLEEHVT